MSSAGASTPIFVLESILAGDDANDDLDRQIEGTDFVELTRDAVAAEMIELLGLGRIRDDVVARKFKGGAEEMPAAILESLHVLARDIFGLIPDRQLLATALNRIADLSASRPTSENDQEFARRLISEISAGHRSN